MNFKHKFLFAIFAICLLPLAIPEPVRAQTTSPPGLFSTLQSAFDAGNSNALIHANELNLTPLFKWDAEREKLGGGLRVDWWISDQQGMALSYTEYQDRSTFWNLGYQARTVFKGLEVALGTGITQNTDNLLGTTRVYIEPSITYKLPFDALDVRLNAGATLYNASRPNAFAGLSLRFFK
jgi:hypothetical protein